MTTPKPESRLQRRIQGALAASFPGCFTLKYHVSEFNRAGTPDLICCIHGYFFAFEVKLPGEDVTPLQAFTLDAIRRAGGFAVVVSSPEQAVARVQELLKCRA